VNLVDATQKGVAVFNSPFPNTRSVAELVMASAIMLLRKIPLKNKAAHEGIWLKDAKNCFELRGKTLGIIGYGNIGMQVSVMAEALGMQVIYFDVDSKLTIGNAKQVHTLKDLIQHADVITVHVPEETSTQQLINHDAMLQMKKGSILINFARGTVVDLIALKEMIETNHIGGAAIDVFPNEPEKNGDAFYSHLQNLPNILLTPHIGGSTEEAQLNISDDVTNKLLNFLEQGITSGSHTIPALNLPPHPDAHRILHIHKNVPGILSEITNILAAEKINILGQYLKTNQEIGYVVLDVSTEISKTMIESLKMVTDTIKMRVVY
jgi:D-3-phosphoglycerate dehydrogenase